MSTATFPSRPRPFAALFTLLQTVIREQRRPAPFSLNDEGRLDPAGALKRPMDRYVGPWS